MTSPAVALTDEPATPVAKPRRLALAWRADPNAPLAELADEPVTIGCGPRCTIRLTDAGLRPLHGVVTLNEAGPRVRRWAPDSWINGEAFEEAPLACGDRLSFGTAELVVIDLDSQTDPKPQQEESWADAAVPVEELTAPPASSEIVAAPLANEVLTDEVTADDDAVDLATLAGNEWAIPSDYESVTPIEEGIAESVQAWSEALPATPGTDTLVSLPPAADYEAEIEQLKEQLGTALSAAERSSAMAERFNQRQKNHRRRALRLIEALRGRAAEADLLRHAIDERDEAMAELQTRLEAAPAVVELSHVETAEPAALSVAPSIPAEVEDVMAAPTEEQPNDEVETLWSETPASEPAETLEAPPGVEAESQLREAVEETAEETAEWGGDPLLPTGGEAWADTPTSEVASEEESPWGIEQIDIPEETAQSAATPEEEPAEVAESVEVPQDPPSEELSSVLGIDWFADEAAAQAGAEESSEPVREEPPAEPQSFIEKYGHLLPEDDEPVDPVPAPVAVAEPAAEPVAEEESGDDSIDDYMQRLMQRVRGESPSTPDAAAPAVAESEPVAESTVATEAEAEPASKPIQDLSELNRSEAPEATTDMDALRQLANHSARSAIQVASKRESREHAAMRLIGSVIAIVAGSLASMTAASPYGVQFIGGLVAVLGGGWYGVKTLGFFQQVTAAEELGEQPQ